jgi:hypothetical protein
LQPDRAEYRASDEDEPEQEAGIDGSGPIGVKKNQAAVPTTTKRLNAR